MTIQSPTAIEEIASFSDWVNGRTLHALGTNHRSRPLPFQSWQRFKEAFAPELISRAIEESQLNVRTLVDPFGGSGTSALAAQFLGVHPTTAEVNPYLCDLIESKLTKYDLPTITADVKAITDAIPALIALARTDAHQVNSSLPPTFVEPGVKGRWIFSRQVASLISSILTAAADLESSSSRRLVRVIVGGTLVGLSNVRVSGKGRRYRGNWLLRQTSPEDAARVIRDALMSALDDIRAYNNRQEIDFELLRGDSRKVFKGRTGYDLAVFSPPYPNSFDYTDVYNVELWMLGYLSSFQDNRDLRSATLSSHVQLKRDFGASPMGSATLETTLSALGNKQAELWSRHIPEMIGAYFADMKTVLDDLHHGLKIGGEVWMVVGDSRYAGIDIPVATILEEISIELQYKIVGTEPFRSMRSSPQQGGLLELAETLLVIRKAGAGAKGNAPPTKATATPPEAQPVLEST